MADADVPTLEVGFAIDFFDSFGQLKSMDDLIGVTAANAVREYQKVEAATKGMSLSGATASVGTFGTVTTREMKRADKAAEKMVRQIERQVEVLGKSASEIGRASCRERVCQYVSISVDD